MRAGYQTKVIAMTGWRERRQPFVLWLRKEQSVSMGPSTAQHPPTIQFQGFSFLTLASLPYCFFRFPLGEAATTLHNPHTGYQEKATIFYFCNLSLEFANRRRIMTGDEWILLSIIKRDCWSSLRAVLPQNTVVSLATTTDLAEAATLHFSSICTCLALLWKHITHMHTQTCRRMDFLY